jgi:excisionase family DNA binding protein
MRTAANGSERARPVAVPDDEVLTVLEAAALMRCGRTTVFGLIGDGTLPSAKVGRTRTIARADVLRYLEQQHKPART